MCSNTELQKIFAIKNNSHYFFLSAIKWINGHNREHKFQVDDNYGCGRTLESRGADIVLASLRSREVQEGAAVIYFGCAARRLQGHRNWIRIPVRCPLKLLESSQPHWWLRNYLCGKRVAENFYKTLLPVVMARFHPMKY